MGRPRKRRSRRPGRQPPRETADQADPFWVDACGRRMFIVGWTPGGAPYGVFEDEMDAGITDISVSEDDQAY